MLPAAQSSYCSSVPASEMVQALPAGRAPRDEQTVLPSPARLHFWEHQSHLPVWQTGSQGTPAETCGMQALTLGAPQAVEPPTSAGRSESPPSTWENSALVQANH